MICVIYEIFENILLGMISDVKLIQVIYPANMKPPYPIFVQCGIFHVNVLLTPHWKTNISYARGRQLVASIAQVNGEIH